MPSWPPITVLYFPIDTANKFFVVILCSSVQSNPLFVERRILPEMPTAIPVLLLKETERRSSAAGLGILAQGDVAELKPLRVSVVPPHKSICRRVFEKTRSGFWDVIKIAAGAVLGWYLKTYFP